MSPRPGESTPPENFARDHNNNPLLDSYGRPVRRRSALPQPNGSPTRALPGTTSSGTSHTTRQREPLPQPPEYHRAPAHNNPKASAPYSRGSTPQRPPHYTPPAATPYSQGSPGNYSTQHNEFPTPANSTEREGWRRQEKIRHQQTPRRPFTPNNTTRTTRRRFGILKALTALLLIFIFILAGATIWLDTSLQRTDALQRYDGRVGTTAGTNWLLVGSDSRAGLNQEDAQRLSAGELDASAGRTDTIMLVHIPSLGGQARIISFPRDSWVTIPGYGNNKINAAFSLGGAALLQRTIEEATQLRIDHYAEIGFGGFAELVDAVGGITMCLPEPLQDPMAGINLPAGCQELDGPSALGYVRSRYTSANGDLDRVQRQREFLTALSAEVSSAGTLLNPLRSVPIARAITHTLTVNDKDHVWNLAALGWALSNNPTQETVPFGNFIDTFAGSAIQWDQPAAEALFASMR